LHEAAYGIGLVVGVPEGELVEEICVVVPRVVVYEAVGQGMGGEREGAGEDGAGMHGEGWVGF
jgi:hypothetical protein